MNYIEILRRIIEEPDNRIMLIDEFQTEIWEGKERVENPILRNILGELAYDLDYYEPDQQKRNEDWSFYGDDKLESEVRDAIRKIEGLATSS